MQTAKNVFLWPGRDWIRKGLEAYFTVLTEFLWGKHRIMEVYLNVIELGPGIYGAEAASRAYFHKPAAALTETESARLAAILPDPLKWSPARPDRYYSAAPPSSAPTCPTCRRKSRCRAGGDHTRPHTHRVSTSIPSRCRPTVA